MTIIRLVDGVRHCWTGSTIATSMEFDIADGSSYSWSMEFDIVDGHGDGQTALDEC